MNWVADKVNYLLKNFLFCGPFILPPRMLTLPKQNLSFFIIRKITYMYLFLFNTLHYRV